MVVDKSVTLGIVVGLTGHPQTVINDLWMQAHSAVAKASIDLKGIAVYIDDGRTVLVSPSQALTLVGLRLKPRGLITTVARAMSAKPGVAGVIARLIDDNLCSRRVAKALAKESMLCQRLCLANVIVSADTAADRAVWEFRKRSSAELMHGPFAMMAALRLANPVTAPASSLRSDSEETE